MGYVLPKRISIGGVRLSSDNNKKQQLFTVCYAMYGSREVLADDVDSAVDAVQGLHEEELAKSIDEVEVTLVLDEDGNESRF